MKVLFLLESDVCAIFFFLICYSLKKEIGYPISA